MLYALFLEVATLKAVKLSVPSGQILANVKVEGFNSWGEMTRLFTYDEKRNKFYYLEVVWKTRDQSLFPRKKRN